MFGCISYTPSGALGNVVLISLQLIPFKETKKKTKKKIPGLVIGDICHGFFFIVIEIYAITGNSPAIYKELKAVNF